MVDGRYPSDVSRRPDPPRPSLPRDVLEEIRATARRGAADDVARLVEEAVDALADDRAAEAVGIARRAKGMASRSASTREVLGLALYRAEQYREALAELQTYRRMTGSSTHNHVIADCHRALGAPEKGLPLVQEVLTAKVAPEVQAEAVIVAASALADMGRFDQALALLRRFPTNEHAARPHDLRVWYVMGDVLERAGRRRDAAAQFVRVAERDPDAYDAAERAERLA